LPPPATNLKEGFNLLLAGKIAEKRLVTKPKEKKYCNVRATEPLNYTYLYYDAQLV
jgi:hypothetical protein